MGDGEGKTSSLSFSIPHLPFLFCAEDEIRLVFVPELDGAQALCGLYVGFQIFFDLLELFGRQLVAEACACNFQVSFRHWRRLLRLRCGLRVGRRGRFFCSGRPLRLREP